MKHLLQTIGEEYESCLSNYTKTSYDSINQVSLIINNASVINYDKLVEVFTKVYKLDIHKDKYMSCDALYKGEDNELYFIEFKNIVPSKIKMSEIRGKVSASLLIAMKLDILKDLKDAQKRASFILVRKLEYRTNLQGHLLNRAKRRTYLDSVRWAFKNVISYSPDEFERNFLLKFTK